MSRSPSWPIQWSPRSIVIVPVAALFLIVETTFFSANIAKIEHGAWLPLAVAAAEVVRINPDVIVTDGNAAAAADFLNLPNNAVVELGSKIAI